MFLAKRTSWASLTRMTSDEALGRAIRKLRESRKMAQGEFATKIGVTAFVVGRMEAGARPVRAVELVQIARVLGTSVERLLREGTPPSSRELVETAAGKRDAAYSAMRVYAESVLEATDAVERESVELDNGVQIGGYRELLRHLESSKPVFQAAEATGIRARWLKALLSRLADSVVTDPASAPAPRNYETFGEIYAEHGDDGPRGVTAGHAGDDDG